MIHCRVYSVRGILVSKVTEHQRRRSYRGKGVCDPTAFNVRSGAMHTAGNKKKSDSYESMGS